MFWRRVAQSILITCRLAVAIALLAAASWLGGTGRVSADDDETSPSTPAGEVEPMAAETEAAVEPEPADAPTEISIEADSMVEPTPEPAGDAVTETPSPDPMIDVGESAVATSTATAEPEIVAAEIATASPAELEYRPSRHPRCVPAPAQDSESIDAGATFDYQCEYSADVIGAGVAPADIALNWSVAAAVAEPWEIQVRRAPDDDDHDAPTWSEAGRATFDRSFQTGIEQDPSHDVADALDETARFVFDLRLRRPPCAVVSEPIVLSTSVGVSATADPDLVISRNPVEVEPLTLVPELTPLIESPPTVSIVAYEIAPTTFSLTDQVTQGSLTIQIENPAMQCRSWAVSVQAEAFVGDPLPGSIELAAVGDPSGSGSGAAYVVQPSAGVRSVDEPVVISVVPAGAEPGISTQTVQLSLSIPGQIGVGVYTSRATAAVTPLES
jgi:hypothetical protein